MNAHQLFRLMMAERRHLPRNSTEHEWRTRAARKYAWIMHGVPTTEWSHK